MQSLLSRWPLRTWTDCARLGHADDVLLGRDRFRDHGLNLSHARLHADRGTVHGLDRRGRRYMAALRDEHDIDTLAEWHVTRDTNRFDSHEREWGDRHLCLARDT